MRFSRKGEVRESPGIHKAGRRGKNICPLPIVFSLHPVFRLAMDNQAILMPLGQKMPPQQNDGPKKTQKELNLYSRSFNDNSCSSRSTNNNNLNYMSSSSGTTNNKSNCSSSNTNYSSNRSSIARHIISSSNSHNNPKETAVELFCW